MDLSNKYKPILISEFEYKYEILIKYLTSQKTKHLIINGPKYSGKKTLIKFYLEYFNYEYNYIQYTNDNNSFSFFKNLLDIKTNNIGYYFQNKKNIIIIENFDNYDKNIRDYIIKSTNYVILLTHKYINLKHITIFINNFSYEYLCEIYQNIFFIETKDILDTNKLPYFKNINEMYSLLEQEILFKNNKSNQSNQSKQSINIINNYDIYEYTINDFLRENNLNKKQYILEKLNNNFQIQYNVIYNFKDIDTISYIYDIISDSTIFLKYNYYDYYNQLTFMSIDNKKIENNSFKIEKEYLIKKKIKKEEYNNSNYITKCYQHLFY